MMSFIHDSIKYNCRDIQDQYKPKTGTPTQDTLTITLLGRSSGKSSQLEVNLEKALNELGLNVPINYERDLSVITRYAPNGTPALMINSNVVSSGKILTKNQIIKLLEKYASY